MRQITCISSVALLLFACRGCLFSPAPYAPQLKGNWVGRVESVTVTDEAGKQLAVGALRVESGPKEYAGSDISDWRPPYKSYAALPDGGHAILLEKNYKKFQGVVLGFLNQP